MGKHIVLIGDSIFDNGTYVNAGEAVIDQLRQFVPIGCKVSLLAKDGSRLEDIHLQIKHIPSGATHIIMSGGGNDGLELQYDFLYKKCNDMETALNILAEIKDKFAKSYCNVLDTIKQIGIPFTIGTIYEPPLYDARTIRFFLTALSLLNDTIVKIAIMGDVPYIDLRKVCTEKHHFANPIEPSYEGSKEIAKAIIQRLRL